MSVIVKYEADGVLNVRVLACFPSRGGNACNWKVAKNGRNEEQGLNRLPFFGQNFNNEILSFSPSNNQRKTLNVEPI